MRAIFKNPTKGHLAIHDIGGNLIVKLLPSQTFDLTPYIGEVSSIQQLLERVVVNNHIDSVLHNQLRGKKYSNLSPTDYFYLQENVVPPNWSLRITFDNILNSPVIPPTDLAEWNSLFVTETYADTPFNRVSVTGKTVALYGPTSMFLSYDALYGNWNVTSVSDDHYVTEVGDNAFDSCVSLKSVNFPSVTKIGASAFENCELLTGLSFSNLSEVGSRAFALCIALEDLSTLSATTIGELAFFDILIKNAFLPLATQIGANAFGNCAYLTGATMPNAVTISSEAFKGCSSLKNVSFPRVTGLTSGMFTSCVSLTGVSAPLVTKLEFSVFTQCTSLTELDIPSITSIGQFAFNACTSLQKIEYPLLTRLESGAFQGCTSITGATFPYATFVGNNVFKNCTSLKNIMLSSVTVMGTTTFGGIIGKTLTLTIPQTFLASSNPSLMTLTGNNTVTIITV